MLRYSVRMNHATMTCDVVLCQALRNGSIAWHHFDAVISKSCHTPLTNTYQGYGEMQHVSTTEDGVQERLEDISDITTQQ